MPTPRLLVGSAICSFALLAVITRSPGSARPSLRGVDASPSYDAPYRVLAEQDDDLLNGLVEMDGNSTTGGYVFWMLTQYCEHVPDELKHAHSNPLSLLLAVCLAPVLFGIAVRMEKMRERVMESAAPAAVVGDETSEENETDDGQTEERAQTEVLTEEENSAEATATEAAAAAEKAAADSADPGKLIGRALLLMSKQRTQLTDHMSIIQQHATTAFPMLGGIADDEATRLKVKIQHLSEEQTALGKELRQVSLSREAQRTTTPAEDADQKTEVLGTTSTDDPNGKADAEVRPVIFAGMQLVVYVVTTIMYVSLFVFEVDAGGSVLCVAAYAVAAPTFKPLAPAM